MRAVKVTLQGYTPYSQSRNHDTPKLDKETADAHEVRTWREKCTTDSTGQIVIPAMALKQSLDSAAKKLGVQIPGKGKRTYTAFFLSDVFCDDDVALGVNKADVRGVRLFVSSKGIRGAGGGTRVWRTFPMIDQWETIASFSIMDDTITQNIFEETLRFAGKSIGIGRFRPENGGLNGRFKVNSFEWA